MSTSLRVVFMGTPAFAVAGLRGVLESRHEVVVRDVACGKRD